MPTPNPYLALADAADARAMAATPGPWIHLPECANEYKIASRARPPMSFGFDEPPDDGLEPLGIGQTCQGDCSADLNFIAHARTDVPALASAVRDLDKVNTEQAATIAALQIKLAEALALAEAGYREGLRNATFNASVDGLRKGPRFWIDSQTRAAVERLKEAK